jgi:hypothetical protein
MRVIERVTRISARGGAPAAGRGWQLVAGDAGGEAEVVLDHRVVDRGGGLGVDSEQVGDAPQLGAGGVPAVANDDRSCAAYSPLERLRSAAARESCSRSAGPSDVNTAISPISSGAITARAYFVWIGLLARSC